MCEHGWCVLCNIEVDAGMGNLSNFLPVARSRICNSKSLLVWLNGASCMYEWCPWIMHRRAWALECSANDTMRGHLWCASCNAAAGKSTVQQCISTTVGNLMFPLLSSKFILLVWLCRLLFVYWCGTSRMYMQCSQNMCWCGRALSVVCRHVSHPALHCRCRPSYLLPVERSRFCWFE